MSKAAHHVPPIRQFASTLSGVLADWAFAQRRVIELRLAPDQNVFHPDRPPQTYAEFLYRTSGRLHHEPPARDRIHCR